MIKKEMCVYFSLALLLFVSDTYAISITPASARSAFAPNQTITFSFTIADVSKADVYVLDSFSQYVTIVDPQPNGSTRTVQLLIAFPSEYKPGKHRMLFGARELPRNFKAPVGGLAAVQAPIFITVPYQEVYLDAQLSVDNINENEDTEVRLRYENLGVTNISVMAQGVVLNEKKQIIETFSLANATLGSLVVQDVSTYVSMAGHKQGLYTVTVELSYLSRTTTVNSTFTVGTLLINASQKTATVEAGKIVPYEFFLQSFWNEPVKDVYAEVQLYKARTLVKTIKTPTETLQPLEKKQFSVFLDTTDLSEGTYEVRVKTIYAGKTTETSLPLTLIAKNESSVKKTALSSAPLSFEKYSTELGWGALILVLLIFNYVVYKKRKRQKQ